MQSQHPMANDELRGKVAVITGGSSGIGASTARLLTKHGATVVVGYNSGRDRANDIVASLPAGEHRALNISLDNATSIAEAARTVRTTWGKADILVNSAGFTEPIPHHDLDRLDDELFDRMLHVNVRGTFSVIRAFAPLLRAGRDSVVVNVSSISAFTGSGSSIAYCAAKGALDTMTLSLARSLGPEIRVNCVSPGAVATDFVAGRGREALSKIATGTPLKRITEPDDVAEAILCFVLFLKQTTGSRITVDGGRHLV